MKVTREKIGKRDFYSYDIEKEDKHLLLGLNERGDFITCLVNNNPKTLMFEDDFRINKDDNNIIYSLFEELYESSFKKVNEDILFDSYGSTISLRKDEDSYVLNFTKDYGKISNAIATVLFNNCKENEKFIKTFLKMQEYDPLIHQMNMDEYLKVLKNNK